VPHPHEAGKNSAISKDDPTNRKRYMKLTITTLSLLLSLTCLASAGEKMPDVVIKQKLIGYWKSPRHGYQYTSDGIIHMLGGTTPTTGTCATESITNTTSRPMICNENDAGVDNHD
jgi:hypothetical protein